MSVQSSRSLILGPRIRRTEGKMAATGQGLQDHWSLCPDRDGPWWVVQCGYNCCLLHDRLVWVGVKEREGGGDREKERKREREGGGKCKKGESERKGEIGNKMVYVPTLHSQVLTSKGWRPQQPTTPLRRSLSSTPPPSPLPNGGLALVSTPHV